MEKCKIALTDSGEVLVYNKTSEFIEYKPLSELESFEYLIKTTVTENLLALRRDIYLILNYYSGNLYSMTDFYTDLYGIYGETDSVSPSWRITNTGLLEHRDILNHNIHQFKRTCVS